MDSTAVLVTLIAAAVIVSGAAELRPIELASQTPALAPASRGEFEALRGEARALLRKHCGSCHDPSSSTAKPAALKVFNLSEEAWQVRMSKEQLDKAIGRVEGSGATKTERERFRAFVAAELSRRASANPKAEAEPGAPRGCSPRPLQRLVQRPPSLRHPLITVPGGTVTARPFFSTYE